MGEAYQFSRCVDYPQLPEHVYYEGYAHALQTNASVDSMNPRYGGSFPKQRAPLRLSAFIRAFKELNAAWILEAFSSSSESDGSDSPFAYLVRQDLHLADVAMQLHAGSEVSGGDLAWHRDGPNSVLHLSVSLMGRRRLHVYTAEGHQMHWQTPGSVYIGTPFSVYHCAEYPANPWASRILAVQVRFLFPSNDDTLWSFKQPDYPSILERVKSVMDTAEIRVPSLDQVKAVYSQIKNQ